MLVARVVDSIRASRVRPPVCSSRPVSLGGVIVAQSHAEEPDKIQSELGVGVGVNAEEEGQIRSGSPRLPIFYLRPDTPQFLLIGIGLRQQHAEREYLAGPVRLQR
jgi:hypothetical protein